MPLSRTALKERARRPGVRKAIRYTLVSGVAVAVSQVTLFVLFALFHWTARSANVAAFVAGGIPSYYLNRRWAWGKTGRSHLLREVLPFWALAALGLGFSTWAAGAAESLARALSDSRPTQALVVNGATLAAYGVLWVVKFALFNRVIFVTRPDGAAT